MFSPHGERIFIPIVELISITPDAENKIVEMARVSSPPAPPLNMTVQTATRTIQSKTLIKYLIDHQHWSPFEMVSMTIKIITTRDISRQILRHRSFSFQEFSQRYQDINVLSIQGNEVDYKTEPCFRQVRMQDVKNRQNSIPLSQFNIDKEKADTIDELFHQQQLTVWNTCIETYNTALALGIAKEQARALLPEGMVKTQIYMTGSIRSWIHYIQIRTSVETQKEHRDVAFAIKNIFIEHFPYSASVLF